MSANKNATNWLEPFEQYLLESGLAPATIASYMTDVKLFYHALQKPVTACDVTRFDVLSYKQQLLDQRTAVATINKKMNSLQAFNQFLNVKGARKEVFISLRKDKIKVAAGSEDEVEVLTEAETNRLLAYLEQTGHRLRNRLIIHLLLYTGLRVSELCAVKLADVDRLGATIRIIGKGGTYREVPLRPGVVDLIQQYVTQERNGQPFAASDYLLISQRAPKLHRDAVRRLVGAIGQQLGMTLYPHKFRHTFATRLLEKGVALTTVSKLCGHSRVDTSARYYVSTSRQQKKDAVTLL